MKQYYKTLFAVVILALTLIGCGPTPQEAAPTLETNNQDGAIISATGVVVPSQWAALSVKSQGVVSELLVEEGQRVSKGDALLRLGNSESAQAEVARAQENLISAERALNSSQADALKDLGNAYEAVRKAQQALDDFDIPSEIADGTPSEGVAKMYAKVEKARADYEPYRHSNPRNDRKSDYDCVIRAGVEICKSTPKYFERALDDAWADLKKAIRWAELEAGLQQAKSELDTAQKEFDAVSGSSQGASLARAQYDVAQANLAAAQAALANMELTAPFDGVVTGLTARVGEWVAPGTPVMQLGDLNNLRVETTDLSEIDAARVHPKDKVIVTFDALPDVVINGTVLRVANKSAASSGVNYTTVVTLDSIPEGLRWGMTAFVDIEVSQ